MKKVAIITLNGYFNYGNRLQNYALQETVKSLGFDIETVICINKPFQKASNGFNSQLKKIQNKTVKEIFIKSKNKIKMFVYRKENNESDVIRTKIFTEFTHKYIKETNYTISIDDIPDGLSDRYDYFIVGSDQVWNPNCNFDLSINFLTFVEDHKRMAYAPSFGVSDLERGLNDTYKKWISGICKLSVREDDGAEIIKSLTGRDAPVLVDPTLLISKEKWLSIAKEASNKPKRNYLLTYFLGEEPPKYKGEIKAIAKKKNLEVINLGSIREKNTFRTGPSEFIDYINSCSIFCTDSFHGAVFSIILEKPFIVYERMGVSSMFTRIDTLLNKFDLEKRKAEYITPEQVFNINFLHISTILKEEQNKAINFLKDALEIKEE